MTTVQIIIVLFNSEEHIQLCFCALEKQSFNDFEVIVVDNNSTDNSIELLRKICVADLWKNRLRIISLKENSGFADGNLTGFQISDSAYIVTLNVDTEAKKEWLENLVANINERPEIGICASKLVAYGTDGMIDSAGDVYTTLLKGDKRGEGQCSENFDRPEYVFGACAGAALYRRKMLDDIGFFDKDFFLIHEDTDLNLRAQLAGWKVMYVPAAIVYHKVRSSIGKMSELAAYYSLRNSELVRFKNIPFGVFLLCLPQFIIGMISEFVYFAIKHRFFRLYLKAKFDALKLLPKMLSKRKEILRKRKVSNKYILEVMTPLLEKNFIKSKIRKLLHD